MRILLTGSAGMIGMHTGQLLLERGDEVVGIDNFNDYYDIKLKEARNKELEKFDNFTLYRADIADTKKLISIIQKHKIDMICNLAAQAGVRYSIIKPFSYEHSNNAGFLSILEAAKACDIKHIVYASSSSVYGGNTKIPWSETDSTDNPINVYAATKKYNELLAKVYHNLYGMKLTGLRFFTVYGRYNRPDMAAWLFADAIATGKELRVHNFGNLKRDWTYVGDIARGVVLAIDKPLDCEVINLGNGTPIQLGYFIETIEKLMGKEANKKMLPMQPGEFLTNQADVSKARELLGFKAEVSVEDGLVEMIEWFKSYYKVK
jgi:UDP-glucuronate 4-epimerase